MKKFLFHGILAGILASAAGIIYNEIYAYTQWIDFSLVIDTGNIIGASFFGTVLASLGYYSISKWDSKWRDIIFNGVFLLITYVSLIIPIAMELPLSLDSPELFPGLANPMHFFPALMWLATKPIFFNPTP